MRKMFWLAGALAFAALPSSVFAADKTCLGVAADNAGGAGFVAEATCKAACGQFEEEISFGKPNPQTPKSDNGIPDACEQGNVILKCCYKKNTTPTCAEYAATQAANGQIGEIVSTACAASASCSGNKSIGNGQGKIGLGETKDCSKGQICCATYKQTGLAGKGLTTCDEYAKAQYGGQGTVVSGQCVPSSECTQGKANNDVQAKPVSVDVSKQAEICSGSGICCAYIAPAGQKDPLGTSAGANVAAGGGCRNINRGPAALALPACFKDGNCTLDDMVCTGVAFANLLIALSGAAFFATFVYGGALYVLSFMDTSYAGKGKKAMVGAAIGMVIVLSSWTIVNYFASAITGRPI